jgi:gag-polypeptide of LTR copia-type
MSGHLDDITGDKIVLPKFYDNDKPTDSFHLWKLRMEAILEAKEYLDIVTGKERRMPDAEATVDDTADAVASQILYDRKRSKIASLIINSLGNKPLSTIQSVSKDPVRIWMKLEERYASKSINSKLSLVTELQNKKFSRRGNMSDHVE